MASRHEELFDSMQLVGWNEHAMPIAKQKRSTQLHGQIVIEKRADDAANGSRENDACEVEVALKGGVPSRDHHDLAREWDEGTLNSHQNYDSRIASGGYPAYNSRD